ncbi:MAG: HlyC/CorC family transporter [Clostridia bacterium]|nr:HlyC/CorC family transporter [Clostridia bacterium]
MPDIAQQLLLQLVLILLNAFFAATEIAIISLNANKVRARAEDGDKKAVKMLKMIEEPTGFLSTIQVGITLAGFLGSAFAADNFAERLTAFAVKTFDIAPAHIEIIDSVSVVLITLILSYFTLVLGELVPKRIAMRYQEKFADKVCGFISALAAILKPIVWFLTVSTNGVLRIFGIDPHANEESVSEEDIVLMLDAGAEEGTLNQDGIEYIKNVFKLDRQNAVDVMTPRNSIEMIPEDITEEELLRFIENCGYSRIPVYRETVDNVVGVLHVRDYLLKRANGPAKLEDAIFKPTYVPETVHLDLLFKEMQEKHDHIVIVVDEYGATAGLVTMEDILEEIVGEIWDEQDEAVTNIEKLSDNSFKVLTATSIDEFFDYFELEPDEEISSSTVNGWVTEQCGTIPEEGYSFTYGDLTITVTNADELRSHEVSVVIAESKSTETEE